MPSTVNNDVIIYNDLMQTSYLERLQEILEVFNAASQGTMLITNKRAEGDFAKSAFYRVGQTVRHRNVNSTAAAPIAGITMGQRVEVKYPWIYGTVASTEEAFKRRARSLNEFYDIVGRDAADAQLAAAFEVAFASLVAAIGTQPALNVTGSLATDSKKVFTKALRTFGDRADRLRMLVMSSGTYFDLVDQSIDLLIDTEIGVVIRGGSPQTMGKPVLVTDQMPDDKIIFLQQGAVELKESQDPAFKTWEYNDAENFEMRVKGEGTINVSLLGYSFDVSAGANPTLAALGASANWNKHYQDVKSTAGVILTLA